MTHRLARDHGARVHTLSVLDISPTLTMLERTDMAFAKAYYHWFLMLQPAPLPERMLQGLVPFNILGRVGREEPDLRPYHPDAVQAYVDAYADPAAIHASCEDYRASGGIDLEHDRADREAGRRLACPLLALWGEHGVVERCFRPLEDWGRVAIGVRGCALPAGHYLPEEVPDLVADEFESFFGG